MTLGRLDGGLLSLNYEVRLRSGQHFLGFSPWIGHPGATPSHPPQKTGAKALRVCLYACACMRHGSSRALIQCAPASEFRLGA